jgi:hypothetical protein
MTRPTTINRGSRLALSAAALALGVSPFLTGCGSALSAALPSGGTKSVPGIPSGPVLGYVWSSSDATLRPMFGVVGSGIVGQSIVPAGTYVTGAATSATDFGLVEDSSGSLFLLDLPASTPVRVAANAPADAQIVFAPSGNSAIAYVAGGSNVLLVSNLSGQAVAKTFAVPSGTQLASAAVSDTGTVLVATQSTPMRVGTLSASGQFSQLTTTAKLGGVSFIPGVDDALVADASKNTLIRLHTVSTSASSELLASTGINQPLAVSASRDGRWGIVANAGDQNIVRVDLKSASVNTSLTCLCQPSQINMLAGGSAFRVNDLTAGPVWIADLSTTTPKMVFVPAIH